MTRVEFLSLGVLILFVLPSRDFGYFPFILFVPALCPFFDNGVSSFFSYSSLFFYIYFVVYLYDLFRVIINWAVLQ